MQDTNFILEKAKFFINFELSTSSDINFSHILLVIFSQNRKQKNPKCLMYKIDLYLLILMEFCLKNITIQLVACTLGRLFILTL